MPKKQTGVESLMKYMPLAVMAVSLVSGFTLLKAASANHEKRLDAVEVMQTNLVSDSSDIKISQAKSDAKLDLLLEAVKDLKTKK